MTGRPEAGEYADDYAGYVSLSKKEDDIVAALEKQVEELTSAVRRVPDEKTKQRIDGKWSLREVIGHLCDAERVFSYRAFRFSRNDQRQLQGFEQDDYVREGDANQRSVGELLEEFSLLRRSTVATFGHITPEIGMRRGMANGKEITVRALLYVTVGHLRHHIGVIKERYGV
jgi:uncharacterized damage-inducible protein DinB